MARAFANIAASQTDSNLVTAVPGKKIRAKAVAVSCGATPSSVTFNSKSGGAGTAISCAFQNSIVLGEDVGEGWFESLVSEGLTATTGAGSTTGIQLEYDLIVP